MPQDEKDLKEGGEEKNEDFSPEPSGDDQPEKKDEDTIVLKKSDYEKIVADRDNYKEGLLRRKAEDRTLKSKEESKPEGEKVDSKVEVDLIAEKTSAKVLENLGKVNEAKAKMKFLKAHPEYLDDTKWGDYIQHYMSKRGRTTIEDIMEDMEDAVLTHKRSTGELESYLAAERQRGRREGEMSMRVGSAGSAGGVGDMTRKGESEVKVDEEMAKQFGHDPKKVAKVSSSDNVIPVRKLR